MRVFAIVSACVALSACVTAETKQAADDTNVKDERCFATGSNLPRKDCRDVMKVDPTQVNIPPPMNKPPTGGR